jgi:hypothetical protein
VNKITKRAYYFFIPFFSLAVIICYSYFFKIQMGPLESLDKINIPEHIKNQFFSDPGLKTLLINIESNKINYYYNGPTTQRLTIILMRMKKILRKYPGQISNGNYLLSLRDGIHAKHALPLLAFATTQELNASNAVILIPDSESLKSYKQLFQSIQKSNKRYTWNQKIPKILWRGATTGGKKCATFDCSPRLSFIASSKNLAFIDAGFTITTINVIKPFARELRRNYLKPHVPPHEAISYKYLLDIDGNSCSYSRMAWILASNSLLLKHQSDKIQWYYHKLKPYQHYLPIASDFSNLQQQYEWAESHSLQVQSIVRNSQQLALEIFNDTNIDKAIITAFNQYHEICAMLN